MPLEPRPAAFFVGDHPAVDFINSRAMPAGVPIEWLGDGADLLGWLEEAALVGGEVVTRFRAEGGPRLDAVAAEARALRQWLRAFAERHAGSELTAAAAAELEPLNRWLAQDDSYPLVEAGHSHVIRQRRVRRWSRPEHLLLPVAEAITDLVCHADFRRLHACEGSACTLMFLDRTKAHARRWCSMAVCGNRAKAAAHRARASAKRS